MPRILGAALGAVLLLSACKVERTPPEFFDHGDRIEEIRESAAEELRDRVLALGQALGRGSPAEAMLALAPHGRAAIVAPVEGVVLMGPEQIGSALARLAATPVALEMRDVRVEVGPQANVAWFYALVEAPGSGPEGTLLRVTGVYVRDEGAWSLVQAHVSIPTPAGESPDTLAAPPVAG